MQDAREFSNEQEPSNSSRGSRRESSEFRSGQGVRVRACYKNLARTRPDLGTRTLRRRRSVSPNTLTNSAYQPTRRLVCRVPNQARPQLDPGAQHRPRNSLGDSYSEQYPSVVDLERAVVAHREANQARPMAPRMMRESAPTTLSACARHVLPDLQGHRGLFGVDRVDLATPMRPPALEKSNDAPTLLDEPQLRSRLPRCPRRVTLRRKLRRARRGPSQNAAALDWDCTLGQC
jgi:hypothetical protein